MAHIQSALRIAAPSWLVPGPIAANARYLQDRVDEIGLCFFEWQSCLDYGEEDLPAWLAGLPLSWHLHLPLDLPWQDGCSQVFEICNRLWEKAAFLSPRFMVLHPPAIDAMGQLAKLAERAGPDLTGKVLVENLPQIPLLKDDVEFLAKYGYGFCLDLAHAVGYSANTCMALAARASLAHWSAPLENDRHESLDLLSMEQIAKIRLLVSVLPANATHMLEIFNRHGFERSLPILKRLAKK